MKRILLAATVLLALAALGCGDKTEVRVNNQLTNTINVSFTPTAGSAININNVSAATISAYSDLSEEGMATIHAGVSSGDAPADITYTFVKGHKYTVIVAPGPPVAMSVVQD